MHWEPLPSEGSTALCSLELVCRCSGSLLLLQSFRGQQPPSDRELHLFDSGVPDSRLPLPLTDCSSPVTSKQKRNLKDFLDCLHAPPRTFIS